MITKIKSSMEIVGSAKNEKKETPKDAKARRGNVKFKPRKSLVLVDILEIKSRTASGILLPEGVESSDAYSLKNYDKHPLQAVVLALGPDCGKMPLGNTGHTSSDDIKVGDIVAFRSIGAAATGIVEDGHIYTLLSDHDIVGII